MRLFCVNCASLTNHVTSVRHPDLYDCGECGTTRDLDVEDKLVVAGVASCNESARRIYLNGGWEKLLRQAVLLKNDLKPDGDPVDS
jgi:hypothetical protein